MLSPKGSNEVRRQPKVKKEQKYYLKVILIFYFLWSIVFEVVGWYATILPMRDFTSALDRQIPLIPEFVWVYILCYVFPLLPVFVIKDWHRFNRGLLSIILANLSAFLVYLTLPVAFPRPELGHSLSERLLAFIYGVDFYPGANKLPSLHVTFAWTVYLVCRKQRLNRLGEGLVLLLAGMITISALFVKQHIILDVVVGTRWAFAAWVLARYLYRLLIDQHLNAKVGLRQMTRKLTPIFLVFSCVLILVIWL
jgi:membrane-associated phospholipid phosphatase